MLGHNACVTCGILCQLKELCFRETEFEMSEKKTKHIHRSEMLTRARILAQKVQLCTVVKPAHFDKIPGMQI